MKDKENIKFNFKLENQKISTRYYLLFIVIGVLFFGIAFWMIVQNWMIGLIIDVVVGSILLFTLTKIKPTYIEFTVFDDHLIINHYSVVAILRDYHTIRINFSDKFYLKIKDSFFKLKRDLILSVETPHGIADYPPISISILREHELMQMSIILNKLVAQNN